METKTKEKETINEFFEPITNAEIEPYDKDILVIADAIKKKIEVMKKLLDFVVSITFPSDWVRFGASTNNAYLTSGGAERVARQIGITWNKYEVTKEQREGYYFYIFESMFKYENPKLDLKIEVPAMGTCSSKDKFFALRGNKYLPQEEVDEPSIMKKALSNMIRNGVCMLLGLKDMPKEAFPQNYWQSIPVVEFQSGKEGGQVELTQEEKERIKKLTEMIFEMCGQDKEKSRQYLKKITEFTGKDGEVVEGIDDPKKLRGKRLDITYGKVKKEYEKWIEGFNPDEYEEV